VVWSNLTFFSFWGGGGGGGNVPRQWADSLVVLSMVFRCFVSAFMGFLLVCG